VYDIENVKGGEGLQLAKRKKGVSKRKVVGFAPAKQKKIVRKKDLHPKESEKADVRLERERMLALRRQEVDKLKLKQRQEELRLIIDAQKKAKQAKIDADIKAKELKGAQNSDNRKAKAEKKKSDDLARRNEIEKWRMEKKKGKEDAKKSQNKRVKVKKK
jgi:chromatin assembly factor 1 subunit A